jgi:hypothetical protein
MLASLTPEVTHALGGLTCSPRCLLCNRSERPGLARTPARPSGCGMLVAAEHVKALDRLFPGVQELGDE